MGEMGPECFRTRVAKDLILDFALKFNRCTKLFTVFSFILVNNDLIRWVLSRLDLRLFPRAFQLNFVYLISIRSSEFRVTVILFHVVKINFSSLFTLLSYEQKGKTNKRETGKEKRKSRETDKEIEEGKMKNKTENSAKRRKEGTTRKIFHT